MSDSDSSSDSESEEVQQSVAKPTVQADNDSDSSSDSSDDEEPKKTAAPAKKADSSSDDSSSDEEEEKPAKVEKCLSSDSSDDSDDSDDDDKEAEKVAEAAKKVAEDDDSSGDDSDDSDDDDKEAAKKAAEDDSSPDDSSSDEAEKNPAPVQKVVKAKENSSDSSSDDEAEEKKPEPSKEAEESDEEMEDVSFEPFKQQNVTVLFEWNFGKSKEKKALKSSKKQKKAKPSKKRKLDSAVNPPAKKKQTESPKAKEDTAAAATPAASGDFTPTKDYNPEDFRSAELKGTTNTIFVKGIDMNAFEADISKFFEEHVAKPVSVRHKWEEGRPALAWVTFASNEQASKAVIDCNNEYIKDRYVNTDWSKPQTKRPGSGPRNAHLKGTTDRIFVGGVPQGVDSTTLSAVFEETAKPTDTYVVVGDGFRPQIAFMSFESNDMASTIVEKFQGVSLMGSSLRLDWAEKRKDGGGGKKRSQEISKKQEGCVTCFVGRLNDEVDDEKLIELFKEAGEVTSIRYMERDGEFKGVAFVQFAATEMTDEAVKLNGTNFLGKTIRVDFAEDKKKKVYAEDWDCKACGTTGNFGSRSECFKCGEAKA